MIRHRGVGGGWALPGASMPEPITFSSDMAVVTGILAFTVYLFAFEVVRVDVAALLVLVVLGFTGLVPSASLFAGFSSNAVISIIAVMIIGAGLDKTGVMSRLASYILRVGGSTEKRIVPIISGTVGAISCFMQNIGAAALFLPVVSRISTRTGIPLSRLLMPMGFCAILGGTMTMIGSSPLILLNDLIQTSNEALPRGVEPMQTFHLFDVTPVGFCLVAVGIIYFVIAGRFVLPRLKGGRADPGATSRYFEDRYGIKANIFEAQVTADSSLVGLTVGEVEDLNAHVYVIGIKNADELRIAPPETDSVWVGSIFALMGEPDDVRAFARAHKLKLQKNIDNFVDVLNPSRAGISEAVLRPGSSLIGTTIEDFHAQEQLRAHVLAIYRGEETITEERGAVTLHAGDTLVLHSRWDDLHQIANSRHFVVVTDYPREVTRPKKLAVALFFLGLSLALVMLTDMRLALALFIGAAGMVVSGVLSMDEAYQSVGWQSVFLLASLIPLGVAVESTQTAAWIAQETVRLLGDVPLWVLQTVIACLATAFTLVMSNVGATVLLVPLAVNIAVAAGGEPAIFALTVALATSNSFLLPTHQVNALVMGAAGYRVSDFIRAGSVMTILFLIVMLSVLNLLY